MKRPVAIDARLIGGEATGDSTYWTGLLHGLLEVAPGEPLLFISNVSRPLEIPWSAAWRWILAPARSGRWWSLVTFPLTARRSGAGAVHTQYNLSPLVSKTGITTIHDVSFFIGPEWFGTKDRLLLQRFVPAAVKRAARVIAVSETCRQEIERFIPAAKGKTVVTLEAAPPWIKPTTPEAARNRVAELTGVAEPFLFSLGTDWARKNQALAVDAVQLVPTAPRLYVGGKSGVGSTESVRRLGYLNQADLGALYSAATAHVLPSLHEGFGLTVLEAFTCGCPVLCGPGGALPEVAGGAAVVAPDYSPATWANALQEMLSSNLDELRDRGRRRAAEFSWAETARRTLLAYEEVVNA